MHKINEPYSHKQKVDIKEVKNIIMNKNTNLDISLPLHTDFRS